MQRTKRSPRSIRGHTNWPLGPVPSGPVSGLCRRHNSGNSDGTMDGRSTWRGARERGHNTGCMMYERKTRMPISRKECMHPVCNIMTKVYIANKKQSYDIKLSLHRYTLILYIHTQWFTPCALLHIYTAQSWNKARPVHRVTHEGSTVEDAWLRAVRASDYRVASMTLWNCFLSLYMYNRLTREHPSSYIHTHILPLYVYTCTIIAIGGESAIVQ